MLCKQKKSEVNCRSAWHKDADLRISGWEKTKINGIVAGLSLEVQWVRAHTTEKAKMSLEDMQIAMRMRERMSSPRSERNLMERSC